MKNFCIIKQKMMARKISKPQYNTNKRTKKDPGRTKQKFDSPGPYKL